MQNTEATTYRRNGDVWTKTRDNDFDGLRRLLAEGADPNELGGHPSFCTPLDLAVYYSDVAMVKLLLAYGADVEKCNHHGHTPLRTSLHHVERVITEMLLQHGAIVHESH